MNQQLIITAVGPDRPGLVGEFAGVITNAKGNILDSRMVNLRGQFALVVLLECPADLAETMKTHLQDAAKNLNLHMEIQMQAPPAASTAGAPMKLKTYSMDQPGIVHRITRVLQFHAVNIEELSCRQESAPFMGTPLFLMEMRVTVPPSVSIRKLREELEVLCDTLNCSLDFEPAAF